MGPKDTKVALGPNGPAHTGPSLAVFPLSGQKRACQCMPGPVAFPLSLPGLDRASSVLPQGQRPGFLARRKKTLGQSRPAGARGVVMNKGRVSPRLESVSAADHFIKLTAITTVLKTFKIFFNSSECLK